MNRKIANRSVEKLVNVKPPLKSIFSLPPTCFVLTSRSHPANLDPENRQPTTAVPA
jgi:hypothetical protein